MTLTSPSKGGHPVLHIAPPSPPSPATERIALDTLPYDILLLVATFMDLRDVHALHLTCRFFRDFSMTRPVYRQLAYDLLARCRPLPLRGFTQPSDLSAPELMRAVNKAHRIEQQWRTRIPRPLQTAYPLGVHPQNNYLDCFDDTIPGRTKRWYRMLTLVHPHEEIDVDWISSITSNYLLCATKTGKVICWDIPSDTQIAEWSLGLNWELWKCRVDFSKRCVYFAMAEKPSDLDHGPSSEIIDFIVVQLYFPPPSPDGSETPPPRFSQLTTCRTVGLVMNFFLLDPLNRTVASFVQISGTSGADPDTIALYMLLDWDEPFYIFIDTGLQHAVESNWTCILLDDILVVHSQEAGGASQHMYPLSLLRQSLRPSTTMPEISGRVPPFRTLKRSFAFPRPPSSPLNDFHLPPWTSESAHFVRQWWPKLNEGHRASSSVLLLRNTLPGSIDRTYALAQHYFMVPMGNLDLRYPPPPGSPTPQTVQGDPIHMWRVRSEYEICSIVEVEEHGEERRPLIAVDFGHAVWVEYKDATTDEKILRFVTFPELDADVSQIEESAIVHTLEIPPELDLDKVETINLDQSHGTIILSMGGGQVFILCYE